MKFFKVTTLPGSLENDAFYFVDNGTYAESYLTGSDGTAHSIGNTAMIQAIAGALITTQLAAMNRVEIVADITARNALNTADRNQLVLVTDASADATVDAGAALYVFQNSDNSWVKVAEYESMDLTVTWSSISGRPSSSAANIDDAVTKRHTHANLSTLDKFGESGGSPTFDGDPIAATWTETNW